MNYKFGYAGAIFNFGHSSSPKDGYFEYIDTASPNGIRRLGFIVEFTPDSTFKTPVQQPGQRLSSEERTEIMELYKGLLATFNDSGVVIGAVVTGVRFQHRPEKGIVPSCMVIFTNERGVVQWMFTTERATFYRDPSLPPLPAKTHAAVKTEHKPNNRHPQQKRHHPKPKVDHNQQQPAITVLPVEETPAAPASTEQMKSLEEHFNR